ncbi:hypothetical protein [Flavobacterium lacus]|uniref:Uncharacterized protein n=1 Tax=Flavobacterium lacus TaxID=1353778 RepID=A0A328WL31_9FLAO|nr:hypothetical protein [Flavobacterium lacus]RAR47052.1 hypothetical protein B0I10_11266 [Flavobacterium lacus]
MKYNITINSILNVNEIPDYWNEQDYLKLLELFNFPDPETIAKENLLDYLKMAITDEKPTDAAVILLTYKLSEELNEGQISQISNDMLLDKVCEEYPEIDLHAPLFHINQLLYLAYNGRFPNATATILNCEIIAEDTEDKSELGNEQILKILAQGLGKSALLKRLFPEQLAGAKPFPEANDILWELESLGSNQYKLITSEYWLSKSDFDQGEYMADIVFDEEMEEE